MLLSIIIPVYNVEEYLCECMDSILSQDLTNCEVICIDDGSTDGCSSILANYQHKYPEVMRVFTKPNGGLSDARNYGVHVMRGEYIYFVDSDDYLRPFAIDVIKQSINSNPNVDIIQYDNVISDKGKRLSCFPNDSSPMSLKDYFLRYHTTNGTSSEFVSSVCVCSYSYSYSYWKANQLHFDVGLRYEDAMFFYRLCVLDGRIKLCHVEEPFYVYRVGRTGSISTNVSMSHYADRQYIWREADRLFRENKITTARAYNNLFRFALWVFIESANTGYLTKVKRIINNEDFEIFKKGIMNYSERRDWILLKCDITLCIAFLLNRCSLSVRRAINVFFTYFDRICPRWLINDVQ